MRQRTIFSSVLLIGVMTAALAGGTFAIFTDTESTHVRFQAGRINITLGGEVHTETYLNPNGFDDWKPGDYETFDLSITNTANKAWIQVYIYETPPWTQGRANFWDVAQHGVNWAGGEAWNEWVLDTGETLDLGLWVDFPQSVGNDYQGAQGDLLILVVAKQWRNKFDQGYSCIALEDKGTQAPWLPDLSNDLEGIICFKPTGVAGELEVDLNAYGLKPDAYYQLDFTGGDMNNAIDPACTTQDDNLAGMANPADLYTSGYWNWGTFLEAACNAGNGGEGVWNYAGVYGGVQANATGSISYGAVLTGLPSASYAGIGAHVKEVTGTLPGTAWTVILSEMDYLSFIIP